MPRVIRLFAALFVVLPLHVTPAFAAGSHVDIDLARLSLLAAAKQEDWQGVVERIEELAGYGEVIGPEARYLLGYANYRRWIDTGRQELLAAARSDLTAFARSSADSPNYDQAAQTLLLLRSTPDEQALRMRARLDLLVQRFVDGQLDVPRAAPADREEMQGQHASRIRGSLVPDDPLSESGALTYLTLAAADGNVPLSEWLVEQGFDPTRGATPYMAPSTGIQRLNTNDLQMIMQAVAAADARGVGARRVAATSPGLSPLELLINTGPLDTVIDSAIFADRRIVGTTVDGDGILHWAVARQELGMIERLLELGADPNTVSLKNHVSPLAHAVCKGNQPLIDLLLRHGADPDAELQAVGAGLTGKAKYGNAYDWAKTRNSTSCVKPDKAWLR